MAEIVVEIPTEKIAEMVNDAIEKCKHDNDIVRVVRCKDCKNCWKCGWALSCGDLLGCKYFDKEVRPEDFCSHGERREEE